MLLGLPLCTCPPGILQDSNGGCSGYECTVDEDCASNRACVAYRCRDPCPGSCGIGASCRVEKHHPVCSCNHGLTGNPLIRCFLLGNYIFSYSTFVFAFTRAADNFAHFLPQKTIRKSIPARHILADRTPTAKYPVNEQCALAWRISMETRRRAANRNVS